MIMINTDIALQNLKSIEYIVEAPSTRFSSNIGDSVGKSAATYKLTDDGLETLQSLHPPIALRLKAWIAVLPPWLVLIGSIAGGAGAVWKIIEFGIQIAINIKGP
jgi:hypothetical protein